MKNLRETILSYVEKYGPINTQAIWLGIGGVAKEKHRVYQQVSIMKRLGALHRDPIGRYSAPVAPVAPVASKAAIAELDDLFPPTTPSVDLSAVRDAANPIISLLDADQSAIVHKIPQHGLICAWLAVSDIEALRDALMAS